jgi:glycosyltransferase involved in cell wall biosynthesis
VFLEAMSVGLPVIGTLSGGPPSFVNVVPGEEDGWQVPPDDEPALAAAMASAVHDADERRRRGANAARHVREAWSWDAAAARVEALYERVLRPS